MKTGTKMRKLRDMLTAWMRQPDKRPRGLTLLMIESMCIIYNTLAQGQDAYFLMDDLVPYLEKCGIAVIPPHGYNVNFTARAK